MESQFKSYSIGYVVEDILEDSLMVKVFPVERIPATHGDANYEENLKHKDIERLVNDPKQGDTNFTDTTKYTTVDKEENVYVDVIDKTNIIEAKWLPIGYSNRMEPPTVCKGETVQLLRLANSDKYFWHTIYNELDLRKLEKATYVFSNKRTIEDSTKLSDVYYYQVDTINKVVRLHTDDGDGEYTTYDYIINTEDGNVEFVDGKNNRIYLDSQADVYDIEINKTMNVVTGEKFTLTTADVINIIENRYDMTLSKFSVKNDTAELMQTISDFMQAVTDAVGIGNLGIDVPFSPADKSTFQELKSKIDSFIG